MSRADLAFRTGARALGLRVRDDQISHKSGQGPIAGAHARIETAGDVNSRITATRLVAVGVFALLLRKKEDHRTLWLTIQGQGYEIAVEVNRKYDLSTRRWVAEFNSRAARMPAGPDPRTAPYAYDPAAAAEVTDQHLRPALAEAGVADPEQYHLEVDRRDLRRDGRSVGDAD
jgi:hypothetical protein